MRSALLLLFLLLLPSLARAEDDPYADLSSLTQVAGRYSIGPWQGALVGGQNCQLLNTETLDGVELSFSAVRGGADRSVQLGAEFLHSPSIREVKVQFDQDEPQKVSFGNSRFGLFYNATPEQILRMRQARFMTYTIGQGTITFDLRGFDRAYALYEKCLGDQLPRNLPFEPLQEGDPRTVAGAPNWQVIDLTTEGFVYERLANLDSGAGGDYALGLWVHNRAQYVLGLTALHEMPILARPHQAVLTLDGATRISLPYQVRADGLMIRLPLVVLRQLAKASQLEIDAGAVKVSYNIANFGTVAQAIQFTD